MTFRSKLLEWIEQGFDTRKGVNKNRHKAILRKITERIAR